MSPHPNYLLDESIPYITELSSDTAAQAFQILKIENYTIKIPGDLNQDGTLSLTDLIPLQQSLLRQTTLTADQAQLADYNGDGSINVLDLMLLKRALLAL